MSKLFLLNAPICHTPGLRYTTSILGRDAARIMVHNAAARGKLVSAIGHDGAAQVLGTILAREVPVSRITMNYTAGDSALALQLKQRQPEGVVLTAEQVEEIGYTLTLIETAPAPACVVFGSAVRWVVAQTTGDPCRYPRDIDVAFAGMDPAEARELAKRWARDHQIDLALARLDLHPEMGHFCPPATQNDQPIPAHRAVWLPYPAGDAYPPITVLAGDPEIRRLPINNFASLLRRLGSSASTLDAGKAIAGWVADSRDGLRVLMARGLRTADTAYKEGSLEGIRAGWLHLLDPHYRDPYMWRTEQRHREIIEHINGYVAGLGSVLDQLIVDVDRRCFAECSRHARFIEGAQELWGDLRIVRRGGPVYEVRVGEVSMTFDQATSWLASGVMPVAAAA